MAVSAINHECDRLYRDALGRLDAGQLKEAVAACQALAARFPRFADGWYLSSVLAQRLGNPVKAVELVERALALDGGNALFTVRKATVLLALSRGEDAAALIRGIDTGQACDLQLSAALATYYTQVGDHAQALRHYRAITQLRPDSAQTWFNLAATERFLGHIGESEAAYTEALNRDPGNSEAFYLRSGLRTQGAGDNHVAELRGALGRLPAKDWMGKAYLNYALAKEYEDLGDYPASFDFVTAGAHARRANMSYDVADDVATIDQIIATYAAGTMTALLGGGSRNDEPIFILGLPRTGTTLVERILGSHSGVHAAGELNNFALEMSKAVRSAAQGKALSKPEMIAASRDLDFAALGDAYVQSTRPQTGRTPHFLDKMPLNYLYCGLIAAALPNAKIVELVRHPLDTCYAIYKQLFTAAYPFSYSLDDIGEYYAAYIRLMNHWHAVLPGRIYRLPYERLIADQQRETEGLLAFCALEYEPACSRFEDNPDACTTASAAQVRQKIYASSVGKWRRFAEQLAPLSRRIRSDPAFAASGLDYEFED
jgi:tetratricopeptide (TPR) repeat protein